MFQSYVYEEGIEAAETLAASAMGTAPPDHSRDNVRESRMQALNAAFGAQKVKEFLGEVPQVVEAVEEFGFGSLFG